MGGCAAALAACRAGRNVVLTEETDWLGGQMTSQGVSALDEHRYIETFGGTESYQELRGLIRAYYYKHARPVPAEVTNPGNGWVSRLCFEPLAGLWALNRLLGPFVESGRLTLLLRHAPVSAEVDEDTVRSVTLRDLEGDSHLEARGTFVLDATELGDLLPLTGAEYVTGVQSQADTGEPNAPNAANPDCQQSFTYPFVLEFLAGEQHRIRRPEGYEALRDLQPYTLEHFYHDERGWTSYRMFETGPGAVGPFWTYRRLIEGSQFTDPAHVHDLAMINWPGNDFRGGSLIDVPPAEALAALRRAADLSLGFCYWLQMECPRDEGGHGYPEFHLRPDLLETVSGLSKYPYIRESRRIRALETICEQDIAAGSQPGARARYFPDSVGVGFYAIDIHPGEGEERLPPSPTRPFQIPLRSLIPVRLRNLLPACKNLGVTHITNGAYRLHPVEWNIGESAAHLALFCMDRNLVPSAVTEDGRLRRFQRGLVRAGIPLHWYPDVPQNHPAFAATQLLAAWGVWTGDADRLEFRPSEKIGAAELRVLTRCDVWARGAMERLVPELLPRWNRLNRETLAGAAYDVLSL
jgi:hypothetical protein